MKEHIEAVRAGWKYRAIDVTHGNQTRIGCLVLAVIGKRPKNPPMFSTQGCIITKSGLVVTHFQTKDGTTYRNHAVCTVEDLNENFRGLADALKLPDAQRNEMFDALRKWIIRDERATSTSEFQ